MCYEEFSEIPGRTDIKTDFFVRCKRTYILNNISFPIEK